MPKLKEHVMPKIGTIFEKKYRGRCFKLAVVRHSGETVFALGGEMFKTPTAAAKSITKSEINGWFFWGIEAYPRGRGRHSSVTVKHT